MAPFHSRFCGRVCNVLTLGLCWSLAGPVPRTVPHIRRAGVPRSSSRRERRAPRPDFLLPRSLRARDRGMLRRRRSPRGQRRPVVPAAVRPSLGLGPAVGHVRGLSAAGSCGTAAAGVVVLEDGSSPCGPRCRTVLIRRASTARAQSLSVAPAPTVPAATVLVATVLVATAPAATVPVAAPSRPAPGCSLASERLILRGSHPRRCSLSCSSESPVGHFPFAATSCSSSACPDVRFVNTISRMSSFLVSRMPCALSSTYFPLSSIHAASHT